jgi:hypothetical protein
MSRLRQVTLAKQRLPLLLMPLEAQTISMEIGTQKDSARKLHEGVMNMYYYAIMEAVAPIFRYVFESFQSLEPYNLEYTEIFSPISGLDFGFSGLSCIIIRYSVLER